MVSEGDSSNGTELVIAGSRSLHDELSVIMDAPATLVQRAVAITDAFDTTDISKVISGTAYGPDTWGEKFAAENDIPVEQHPANTDDHGIEGYFIRNEEMAEVGDGLLALWDGSSNGTEHMIESAREEGCTVEVIRMDKEPIRRYVAFGEDTAAAQEHAADQTDDTNNTVDEESDNREMDVEITVVNKNTEAFDLAVDRHYGDGMKEQAVGEPGCLGNPFKKGVHGDRQEVISKFVSYWTERWNSDAELREYVAEQVKEADGELRLGCHCAPKDCHGDVIKETIEMAILEG